MIVTVQSVLGPTQDVQQPVAERLLPKVHVNLGITLEAAGRLQDACSHYRCACDCVLGLPLPPSGRHGALTPGAPGREAARLEPSHYRARKLLGSALFALGDLRAARAALSQALALRPDYADAHCDLGGHPSGRQPGVARRAHG